MTRMPWKAAVGACACLVAAISAAGCGGSSSPQASGSPVPTVTSVPSTVSEEPTTASPETPPVTAPDTSSPTSDEPTTPPTGGPTASLPAGSTYLADLTAVEGYGPHADSIGINGRTYPHSIYQPSSGGNKTETQYDLRRKCQELTFTAGITDDSASDAVIQFEVYDDGRPLKTVRLHYGEDAPQTVNVQNVLRLKLQNNRPSGDQYEHVRRVTGQVIGSDLTRVGA